MDREMFYGAKPDIFAKALLLRENMTDAERLLWDRLKENRMGVRFKPQHPIDIFITDFYCHKLKLVIEIDGEIHEQQKDYDEGRTAEMQQYEIEVIRLTNAEVLNKIEDVVKKIQNKIQNKIHERKLWAGAL